MARQTALQVSQGNRELLLRLVEMLEAAGYGLPNADPVLPSENQPAVVPKADPAPQDDGISIEEAKARVAADKAAKAATSVPSFEEATAATAAASEPPPPPGAELPPPADSVPEPTPEERMVAVLAEAAAANHTYVVNWLNHFQVTDLPSKTSEEISAVWKGVNEYLTKYGQPALEL